MAPTSSGGSVCYILRRQNAECGTTPGDYVPLIRLILACAAATALLTASGRPLAAQQRGAELTISLVTMGQGDAVYERFGHNAIWVHDTLRHTDKQYNYGLFDFRQENFILRFVQGRMLYAMGGLDAATSMAEYAAHNRSIWVQELNLTPAERADLRDFLVWNARPENRNYRYDYYLDNCSTRVRDALDRVLGGRIKAATDRVPAGSTFRFHTARLTTNDPLMFTGLMLGLGEPVDRPITRYEEMFLPLALREHIRSITVPGPNGTTIPLVRSEETVYLSTAPASPAAPPFWLPAYLVIGVVIGGVLWYSGVRVRRSAGARAWFAAIGGLWSLLAGLSGVILAGLWLLTDHSAAYRNENLFQFNPLALPLVVLLPLAAYGRGRARRAAQALAALLVLLGIAGILFKLVPGTRQVNAMLIALALPANIGMWLGLRGAPVRPDSPAASGSPTV
jgi:hypothetical protein